MSLAFCLGCPSISVNLRTCEFASRDQESFGVPLTLCLGCPSSSVWGVPTTTTYLASARAPYYFSRAHYHVSRVPLARPLLSRAHYCLSLAHYYLSCAHYYLPSSQNAHSCSCSAPIQCSRSVTSTCSTNALCSECSRPVLPSSPPRAPAAQALCAPNAPVQSRALAAQIRTHTRCIANAFAEHIVIEEHHFLEMSGGFKDICT